MEQQVESQSPETIPVAWQHNKALAACMIELYDKSLWTDVKFHCKDHDENGRLHAHKIVLAARSPVFQAMFFGPCADGKDEVELANAEAKIMDLFFRYIYSDTVDLDEETAYSVLKMADFYQVTNLVQFCGDYLATILTAENACGILQLAMLYQVTSLRDACCSFIDKNANAILNFEGFPELPEECLRYIIKGDTFFAEENKIYIKAEEWSIKKLQKDDLEKNGQNIRKALGDIFYHLRLPTMTYETLIECTRRKGYFSTDEYEDITEFIHKIPGSSVRSNSCVARLPLEDTLILNEESGDLLDASGSVSTYFNISVTREVTLTNIVLAKIHHHLKYREKHYTSGVYDRYTGVSGEKSDDLFRLYNGKVLQLKLQSRTYKEIKELTETQGVDLSADLDIVISGSLKITCENAKLQEENTCSVENEKKQHANGEKAKSFDTGHHEEALQEDGKLLEAEESEDNFLFKQDFQLHSSQISQRTIKLKEPLTMTKASSPYRVEIDMNYSCNSSVKMKAYKSNKPGNVDSQYGHLQVVDVNGLFAGVKSLGFENSSNR